MNREDEITMLKSQAEALSRSQADIARRIDELEKPGK
jgi:DNA-binding MarR family transcriptional regulator